MRRTRAQLPWRDDPTPYRVWISEIMLQQTRVEAVKPYFERFVREIPDVRALAEVPEERLLKLWEGLGYYSRARNLKKAAIVLTERYEGKLPRSAEELEKLPGIGDYTAGAIASIAYGLPEPAVDGNVLRVAARLEASREDIAVPRREKELRARLLGSLSRRAGKRVHTGADGTRRDGLPAERRAALRRMSACGTVRSAPRRGAEELPVKAPKPERRKEDRTVFLIVSGGTVALRRRPETGLLAGLMGIPERRGHSFAGAGGKDPPRMGDFSRERGTTPGGKAYLFPCGVAHDRVSCAGRRAGAAFVWAIPADFSAITPFRPPTGRI